MGSPENFENFMTAVIHESSFDKLSRVIKKVKKDKDAKIFVGGGYTKSKGYFIESKRVSKRKDLNSSIKQMLSFDGPYLLEVCVEKEDNVFPMIPSGSSVSDIRLE